MRRTASSAGGLLVFLVYGMFALFSLLLVVIGAGVYRGIVETGQQNTAARASLFYLANQVRMCSSEPVLIEQNGMQVLALRDAGSDNETLIYYADGVLCEYYGPAGGAGALSESAGMGERIAELEGFRFERDPSGMLCAAVTIDGTEHSMALCGSA